MDHALRALATTLLGSDERERGWARASPATPRRTATGDMARAAVVLLALLALACARPSSSARVLNAAETSDVASVEASDAPAFCHGIDCPAFDVVKTTDAYEVRKYPGELKWTTTTVTGLTYDAAVSAGFERLFGYISGANAKREKIEMTAPVRVRVVPGEGPFCESNFTVSFFVPFAPDGGRATQIDPPKPVDERVKNEVDACAFTARVKTFGGWARETSILAAATDLSDALRADGEVDAANAGKDQFFYAGYDSPFTIAGRHNEVWFVVPDPDCETS